MKKIKNAINEIVIKEFVNGDLLVKTKRGFKYYKQSIN